jgi:HMG (high mobility group) box
VIGASGYLYPFAFLYYEPKELLTETRKLIFFVAFILYRQHFQAQVVAQHPGLANPEISKIIGEQWREQTPEVKSDWKRLAEVQNSAFEYKDELR